MRHSSVSRPGPDHAEQLGGAVDGGRLDVAQVDLDALHVGVGVGRVDPVVRLVPGLDLGGGRRLRRAADGEQRAQGLRRAHHRLLVGRQHDLGVEAGVRVEQRTGPGVHERVGRHGQDEVVVVEVDQSVGQPLDGLDLDAARRRRGDGPAGHEAAVGSDGPDGQHVEVVGVRRVVEALGDGHQPPARRGHQQA